ncbi:MAG: N-acetyl-D-Glu racemase DgcA [Pseudomonadota bacterium]
MKRKLKVSTRSWRLKEPFVIARGSRTTANVIVVELEADGHTGRGEAVGVTYKGETLDGLIKQISEAQAVIEAGATREELLRFLPAGGARNAVDAAMWDLEAKQSGIRAWKSARVKSGDSVETAITIGMRSLDAYETAAKQLADYPWIKIKVAKDNPVAAVAAVRKAAPNSRLIVDANQAWDLNDLLKFAPELDKLGVDLLEQPLAVGHDGGLAGVRCPIPICADESINTIDDLAHLVGLYSFVNIKLDKTGGLTAALTLAHAAKDCGFRLMSGCMVASSLAMAPAMILAQMCEINDLDGPLLLAEDWQGGINCERGKMQPPWPDFWG